MAKVQLPLILIVLVCVCCSMREGTTGKGRSDVLTAEEIATTNAQNAYDAIILTRPLFLKSRGMKGLHEASATRIGETVPYPVVYVDRMYHGDPESLRTISVTTIREIRYLDFNEATSQFGPGQSGGIILVITKR